MVIYLKIAPGEESLMNKAYIVILYIIEASGVSFYM